MRFEPVSLEPLDGRRSVRQFVRFASDIVGRRIYVELNRLDDIVTTHRGLGYAMATVHDLTSRGKNDGMR